MSETVHGSAVLAGADGVLIRGPSGSGKTLLALLMVGRGARLIADDRVFLSACHGRVIASAPGAIAGRIELRGRGIVAMAHEASAVVRLVIDLVGPGALERMPDPDALSTTLLGTSLPRQPVPDASEGAIILVDAALRALSPQAQGLHPSRVWG